MIRKLFKSCMNLLFSRKRRCVGMDERGNQYFVNGVIASRQQRSVEFKKPEYLVTDIPVHWRMWLYHRLEVPPTEYTEKVGYVPPDISPDYDPYDPRAQKMCLEYIEFLKPQILGTKKK